MTFAIITVSAVALAPVPAAAAPASPAQPPVFAYYYQWFHTDSWNRGKVDFPLLGRYSSEDPAVIRQHVRWAKSAGIDGFIVSWRSTEGNNRRLRLLMRIANDLSFKLVVIYQGLNYYRQRRPTPQVMADFATFRRDFVSDPAFFRLRGKPLLIWSGTWMYATDDVSEVTRTVRYDILVLSTERSVDGFRRLAAATDGDAYYWSSVDPVTNSRYPQKLRDMAAVVHRHGKVWVAPFAPGFDARLIGGSIVVPRRLGRTLREEYAAASSSSPDVLALISWNEFSENTHVEPSIRYGRRYLDLVRELTRQ